MKGRKDKRHEKDVKQELEEQDGGTTPRKRTEMKVQSRQRKREV